MTFNFAMTFISKLSSRNSDPLVFFFLSMARWLDWLLSSQRTTMPIRRYKIHYRPESSRRNQLRQDEKIWGPVPP